MDFLQELRQIVLILALRESDIGISKDFKILSAVELLMKMLHSCICQAAALHERRAALPYDEQRNRCCDRLNPPPTDALVKRTAVFQVRGAVCIGAH